MYAESLDSSVIRRRSSQHKYSEYSCFADDRWSIHQKVSSARSFFGLAEPSNRNVERVAEDHSGRGGRASVRPFSRRDCVLQDGALDKLKVLLPERLQLGDWSLVYNSTRDGSSLRTLLSACKDNGPAVVAVRDASGSAAYAFSGDSIRTDGGFCGSADSTVGILDTACNSLERVFPASGLNAYYCLVTLPSPEREGFIMFGAGNGCALSLNDSLSSAKSTECDTYKNTPLFGSTGVSAHGVVVKDVEVWILGGYMK